MDTGSFYFTIIIGNFIPVKRKHSAAGGEFCEKGFFTVCTKKSAKFVKKSLHFFGRSCILIDAVTLIAMKREVAARMLQVFRGANVKL